MTKKESARIIMITMNGLPPFMIGCRENNIKPLACEKVVSNDYVKIAGSVDFIGHDEEGSLFFGGLQM